MNEPTTHDHADDTKVYDGPDRTAGHAVPNTDKGRNGQHDAAPGNGKGDADHGNEGPVMKLDPIGTGKVILMLVGFAVLFAVLFVLGLYPTIRDRKLAQAAAQSSGNGKPIVSVAAPKPPGTPPTLNVPASAQAYATTALYPRISGYLKKRYVDIGDTVKDGQLLAEIDTPETEAQLGVAQAQLQQAQAAQQKAKDDFELTQATYQRYEGFAKTGGVTQQQLDERRSAFTSAKSTLAGADATVKADEAEVQRLQALLSFNKIYAPFAGTINTRGYDIGALLSTTGSAGGNRELFTISQTDTLRVFVDVPQSYATFLQIGQKVKLDVSNFPGKPFEGYLARTSGSINQQTRTLRVEADFPNKDGRLYPGMYGTLMYQPETQIERLLIPSAALIFGPEGVRVAVVDDKNVAHFRPVTLGSDLGTELEILHGLSVKDRVVTNPGERLNDGTEVAVQGDAPQTAKSDERSAGQGQNKGTTPQGEGK